MLTNDRRFHTHPAVGVGRSEFGHGWGAGGRQCRDQKHGDTKRTEKTKMGFSVASVLNSSLIGENPRQICFSSLYPRCQLIGRRPDNCIAARVPMVAGAVSAADARVPAFAATMPPIAAATPAIAAMTSIFATMMPFIAARVSATATAVSFGAAPVPASHAVVSGSHATVSAAGLSSHPAPSDPRIPLRNAVSAFPATPAVSHPRFAPAIAATAKQNHPRVSVPSAPTVRSSCRVLRRHVNAFAILSFLFQRSHFTYRAMKSLVLLQTHSLHTKQSADRTR